MLGAYVVLGGRADYPGWCDGKCTTVEYARPCRYYHRWPHSPHQFSHPRVRRCASAHTAFFFFLVLRFFLKTPDDQYYYGSSHHAGDNVCAGAQSCISAPILPVYDASHPDANPGPRGNSQWDQGKRGADTQLGITALDEKNSGYSNVANAILYRQETQSIRVSVLQCRSDFQMK